MDLSATIQGGLKFLVAEQGSDGGFLGHASVRKHDFSVYREHPTVFFTALILNCLSDVADAEEISQPASEFLLSHKNPSWSWNYWIPGSQDAANRPYPDDLDDTACALAALHSYDPALLDGAVLGHLAQQLIANETSAGAPYETWLIDRAAHPKWQDVDLAVNANIGFLLSRLGVQVPSLEAFITEALQAGKLQSTYYLGEIPVLYFIARWYHGAALPKLQQRITKALTGLDRRASSLDYALLLSAGVGAGLDSKLLMPAAQHLVARQNRNGYWPAATLYYEPLVNGVQYYAGSEALTTAFALEALSSYQRLQKPTINDRRISVRRSSNIITYAVHEAADIADPLLRRQYRGLLRDQAKGDHDLQISGMASTVARACQRPIAPKTVRRLNLASVHGWIAYTIYDDFLDGEGQSELLSVANLALRRSLMNFQAALPGNTAFTSLVASTFDQVDAANTWEIIRSRPLLHDGKLHIIKLPDYGNFVQLAQRSWGHTLAAAGVLYGLGFAPDSPEVLSLQDFFHHFLIARQLNDDAHDWETDLWRGQLSAVVSLLLHEAVGAPTYLDIEAEIEYLRGRFWQSTIVTVASLINEHLQAARMAIINCQALRDKTVFEPWLQALQTSTEKALSERQETYRFIAAYEGKS